MSKNSGERLVWMDLEMSGLDPDKERILEIAVIVTDGRLEVVAEGPELVVKQDDAILDAMDAWNREHHGASGLVDRVRASTMDDAAAAEEIRAFLQKHCPEKRCPLAGNSVHQDRRFLARYMPGVEAYLHYRLVDVSTVKELVRRWLPTVYVGRPEKKGAHRALDDIRESIEELRYYWQHAFISPPGMMP
ncbi:MAG: oligoribonuclease [Deltaproteobacteria bacterium]|nr:oligoribonuclease [Deltaproteobacteria bacterium]